jgi:hypothetical protein
MRDDRPAMSRPRATLLILVLAAQAAGLLTTGCNPDTHELLLDPRLPIAEPYAGGTWTTSPVLTCGRSALALAAWGRDDLLLVGVWGLAVRVQGWVARNVDAPPTANLVAAVAQPDGSALVAASNGDIYRLDGEAWTVEYRSYARAQTLWRFPDGSVLGVGTDGYGLRRTPDGVWEQFDTGVGVTLGSLWARDSHDCWAAGSDGVVAHFDGTTWSVERPFGSKLYLHSVTGDTNGRVAVAEGTRVLLREDGVWRELPEPMAYESLAGVVLLGGQLLTWNSRGWYRWDGAAWIREGELDAFHGEWVVLGDELGLLSSDGELVRLADGEAQVLLPALGSIADFETTPDGAVILTSNSWIIRETATGWLPDAPLNAYGSWSAGGGRQLIRTASGPLVALAGGRLYRQREAGWESLTGEEEPQWRSLFLMGDGTLQLWDSTGLWTWSDSHPAFLCSSPEAWGELVSAAGNPSVDARYLFTDLLARYDGVTLRPVASRRRAAVRWLSYDPVEGLLLAGNDGLFAGDGENTRDLTPRCEAGVTPARAVIRDFTVTPSGDWLAWTDSRRLLRRRAGLWQSLDGASGSPLPAWGPAGFGRSIRCVEAGDIWLISTTHVYHYRDAAP